MMWTFACSKYDTESSSGRQRSTFATCEISFATGQLLDSSFASLAIFIGGAAPRSEIATEPANMAAASSDDSGKRKLSKLLDSAAILGLNLKYVSSSVTSALTTASSAAVVDSRAASSRFSAAGISPGGLC